MGELILCGGPLAAMPYYIEEVSLNVYSLEELSYYVEQILYLLGPDFMQEELCDWVERSLDFPIRRKNCGKSGKAAGRSVSLSSACSYPAAIAARIRCGRSVGHSRRWSRNRSLSAGKSARTDIWSTISISVAFMSTGSCWRMQKRRSLR